MGLGIQRELGDRQGIAASLVSLGEAASLLGDPGTARDRIREGLETLWLVEDRFALADAVDACLMVAAAEGDHELTFRPPREILEGAVSPR